MWIDYNIPKGMHNYVIFNKGQYREQIFAKNKEEALTKAIQLGYTGVIEVIRMKKYENIGATATRIHQNPKTRPKTWEQYYSTVETGRL